MSSSSDSVCVGQYSLLAVTAMPLWSCVYGCSSSFECLVIVWQHPWNGSSSSSSVFVVHGNDLFCYLWLLAACTSSQSSPRDLVRVLDNPQKVFLDFFYRPFIVVVFRRRIGSSITEDSSIVVGGNGGGNSGSSGRHDHEQ